MALDSKVQMLLSAGFSAGTTQRLQEQLNAISKKLTLNIGKVKINNQQFNKDIESAMKKTTQSLTQNISQQTNEIDKLHGKALEMNKKYDANIAKQQQLTLDRQINFGNRMHQQKIKEIDMAHRDALKMNQQLERDAIQQAQRMTSSNSNAPSSSVKYYDNLQQQQIQSSMAYRLQGLQEKIGTTSRNGNGIISPQQLEAVNKQFAELQNRIGTITNNRMTQQWNTDFTRANSTLRGFNQTIEESSRGLSGYTNNIGMLLKKFADWMVVGTIFMQAINGIREGIQTIYDLNTALVTINMTMPMTNNEMHDLISESQIMAKQMGLSINEVLNAVNFAA